MEEYAVDRVVELFARRGQLERLDHLGAGAARACLERAMGRLEAASVLAAAELWESAFTTAYDAYRTAADAIVLHQGHRVTTSAGAHRVASDVAHAVVHPRSHVFAPASAERFRQGRHESEYFDPSRPIDKTSSDARWGIDLAHEAIEVADRLLSDG